MRGRVELAERALVKVACSYEVVAMHSRLPTITAMNRRQPLVGVATIAALVWHFRTRDD